ncbi:MAG TPA: hypothetical protein VGC77_13495, partial [Rhodopseudomonas sp.]|uniref:beta strand repeat-containing protein n=1 Tax=Rhodopseudomonas sp. TaxID=1078 RepID=UPI002EDA4658
DAGHLVFAALDALNLNATNHFAPAAGGRGGQIDITGTNLLVAAGDLAQSFADDSAHNGYLLLDADQLSRLGAESLLIGGTRSTTPDGTLITASALNLEVATDAAHALTGPELLLVSLAPTTDSPDVHGLAVDAGSVISAMGSVSGDDTPLIIGVDPVALHNGPSGALSGYTAGVSGDGSLLRLSNGNRVAVTRHFVPGLYTSPDTTPAAAGPVSDTVLGNLTLGSGVTISGNTLTLDTSGSSILAPDALLVAKNYDLSGSSINLGNVPAGTTGLTVSSQLIATFAGADSVLLRSASVFNLYGDSRFGSDAAPIGTLTFDGSGLYSDGGTTTVDANNIDFIDSQTTVNTNGALTGGPGGSLMVNAADTVTFGAGAKTLGGVNQAGFTAGQQVLFANSGALDAKTANVTLSAPAVVAQGGSGQSLTTTGALALLPGTGVAPILSATDIGGALTLTGGDITVAANIIAQGGKLTLDATTGDVTLLNGANLNAKGTGVTLFDLTEDTPAGTVQLIADNGNITVADGASVDVSAAGNGYAGTLGIQADKGMATLNGVLKGNSAYHDLGGNFMLTADRLGGSLPLTGFSGSFAVSLGNGDITIANGQTLTSQNVLLVTNHGS